MDDQDKELDLLRELFMSIPYDVYFKDSDRRYRYLNRVHQEVLAKVGQGNPVGKTDFDLIPVHEIAEQFWEEDGCVLETGTPLHCQVDLPDESGSLHTYSIEKCPVKNTSDEVVGVLAAVLDVTDELKNLELIQELSIRDSMTGLLNRQAFDAAVQALDARFDDAQPAALWIDANNLKCVNDVWGHEAGDRLLKSCAHELLATFSDIGNAYRVGGDEFVILFEQPVREEILHRGASVQANLHDKEDFVLPISISIGYADATVTHSMKELLQAADKAMYQDKKAAHKQRSLDMQKRVLHNMEKQGIADKNECASILQLNNKFCAHLGLNSEAQAKIERIITFAPIIHYQYDLPETPELQRTLENDQLDKSFKLLHATFNSVNEASHVLYWSLNWNGEGNWDTLSGREIPFYSRVARLVMETHLLLRDFDVPHTLDALCEMNGRELDPTLCSSMYDLLAEDNKPSNRSLLIRSLSQRYQTNIDGIQAMIQELPGFLFYKDLSGRYQLATDTCSQAARKMGFAHESVIGKTDFEIFPNKELAEFYRNDDLKIIQNNEASTLIIEEIRPSGNNKYILLLKTPVHDKNNIVVGVRGTMLELKNPIEPDFHYETSEG